jgi:hypothetical protein
MSNNIVGVRYVGKKDFVEDTVTKSGATWVQGQVNNFSENLAKELLVHTDSFELADPSADADTYMGKRGAHNVIEPVAFVNLNAMNVAQLTAFARMQFNRTVNTEERTEADIRSEVNALMTNNNLDLEAEERKLVAKGLILEKEVTAEEYQAVLDGVLVLKLVPTELQVIVPEPDDETLNKSPDAPAQSSQAPELEGDLTGGKTGESTPPATITPAPTADNEPPTLEELTNSLDKAGLIAFAKQENVTYANSMNEAQLRAKLVKELKLRKAPTADNSQVGL